MTRNICRANSTAILLAGTIAFDAGASFTTYTVVATDVENAGQTLVRYEIYASFNGGTDTVLNVFNLTVVSATDGDGHSGYWHKDNNDDIPGALSQSFGTWSPQVVGSTTMNRPFDSFVSIGATTGGTSTASADPSWNSGGSGAHMGDSRGWTRTDLVSNGTLGWFNASPPNLQGRVGTNGNNASTVKVAQVVLTRGHGTRVLSLRTAWNNGVGGAVNFNDGTFTLNSCIPTTWYRDLDGDGFGAAVDGTIAQCSQPSGFVANTTDNCPALANPTQADCDSNGIGDVCVIAAGTSDLDENGIPDDCLGEFVVGGSGFDSISAALAAAPDGATIRVGPRTNAPIDLSGRAITVRSIAGPATSFIDGGGIARCVTISGSGSGPTTLEGFTIRGGNAINGGGIATTNASPTFRDCVIRENSASAQGGGAFCIGGAPNFIDCAFEANSALDGGAIAVGLAADKLVATIDRCVLSENSATRFGGAVLNNGRLTILNSTIDFNTSAAESAGLDVFDAVSTTVSGTRFCGNVPAHFVGSFTAGAGNVLGDDCDANGTCDLDEIDISGADTDADGILDTCERAQGDLNLDGIVNNYDLAVILFYWGTSSPQSGDVNGDGDVGSADLSILLSHWGPLN